jgi:hypothetical protein
VYILRRHVSPSTSRPMDCILIVLTAAGGTDSCCCGCNRNGIIDTPLRLSMALRYFAGGNPYDVSLVHGVAPRDVYNSVWIVVDAVNACPDLAITFPENHDDQKKIAAEFKAISRAGFDNCVGAIDGWLVWLRQPTSFNTGEVGPVKFFCGRKHKFGLNMQSVCDARKRFIDVDPKTRCARLYLSRIGAIRRQRIC